MKYYAQKLSDAKFEFLIFHDANREWAVEKLSIYTQLVAAEYKNIKEYSLLGNDFSLDACAIAWRLTYPGIHTYFMLCVATLSIRRRHIASNATSITKIVSEIPPLRQILKFFSWHVKWARQIFCWL